jgi:hypothetical protein
MSVSFVDQSTVGPTRTKPWGTAAAVVAAGVGRDLVVANGDDLYGEGALRTALDWVTAPRHSDAAGIFYPIGPTVADLEVSRGVPTIVDGRVTAIHEHLGIRRVNGVVRLANGAELPNDRPVSMNLWCLRRSVLRLMATGFDRFVEASADDETAEYGLSTVLGGLAAGLHIDALVTNSQWFGVTHEQDVALVREALCRKD